MPCRAATVSSVAVSAGTTEATDMAATPWSACSSSASRSRRRISISSAVSPPRAAGPTGRRDRPVLHEAERDVRVPDVDGEQHAGMIRAGRPPGGSVRETQWRSRSASSSRGSRSSPRRCSVTAMTDPGASALAAVGADRAALRVVVVGGGASGTLVAAHLLRRAPAGVEVVVVEPRDALGRGVAFGTPDPWHRLNVPAITMSGLPEDPDHFRAFAGCAPGMRSRHARSSERISGGCSQKLALDPAPRSSTSAGGERGCGRACRGFPARRRAGGWIGDARRRRRDRHRQRTAAAAGVPLGCRVVRRRTVHRGPVGPWIARRDHGREVAGIIGTGHTALDLAASLLRGGDVGRVVALSRHGEIPRSHEEP